MLRRGGCYGKGVMYMNPEMDKQTIALPTATPMIPIEPKTSIGKLMETLKHELQTPSLIELEQKSGMSAGEIMARIASHG